MVYNIFVCGEERLKRHKDMLVLNGFGGYSEPRFMKFLVELAKTSYFHAFNTYGNQNTITKSYCVDALDGILRGKESKRFERHLLRDKKTLSYELIKKCRKAIARIVICENWVLISN